MGCFHVLDLLTSIVVLLLTAKSTACQKPIVNIPTLGSVIGSQMSSVSGRHFHAFRRIPYAQPPIGDLRFKDPVPKNAWGNDKILDASQEAPVCIQFNSIVGSGFIHGQEDCLYLNIYTPQLSTTVGPLPVMFWIHGGAFYMGSGNGVTDIFGPGYLLDRDIVLITFNYRLGPLGFFSTEDVEAPGNYGLLDQSLALRWVRNHIRHFGGNPDLITIFGESAGGASVNFQMLSPYSKGLFHRAIAQSGSAKCPWGLHTTVGEYSKILASHLNCTFAESRELLRCLREKKAEEIVGIRQHITIEKLGFGMFPLAFVPRIDVERNPPFLPAHPDDLISQGRFNHVPLIAGVTENEGALVTASFFLNDGKAMQVFKDDPIGIIRYMINMETRENSREIAKLVHDQYFTNKKTYEEQIEQIEKITSDYGIFKCTDDSVKLFSQHNTQSTYYYYYSHRGQLSFPQVVGVSPEINLGVCHADELYLIFTSGILPLITSAEDIKVSHTLIDLWTSFARNGVPLSQHVTDLWLPVRNGEISYLNINSRSNFVNGKMPFEPRMEFWANIIRRRELYFKKNEL